MSVYQINIYLKGAWCRIAMKKPLKIESDVFNVFWNRERYGDNRTLTGR